jgi:hypothetical protein
MSGNRHAWAVVMRIKANQRGMSAGHETTSGLFAVHKEAQGASIIVRTMTQGSEGFANLRLDRAQIEQLINDLKEVIT